MNSIAAAWQLVNYQLFARKRMIIVFFLLFLPQVMAWYLSQKNGDYNQVYTNLVSGLLTMTLVPYLSLYVGTMVLGEEIDGKTMVYLWTRPRGRTELLVYKWLFAAFWTVVAIAAIALLIYSTLFSIQNREFIRNIMMLVWDIRGLALGSLTFMALGFFLSTIAKKALVIGLVYAFTWDNFARFMPGFLGKISIHHHMAVLTSHGDANMAKGILNLATTEKTSEPEAIFTLLIVTAMFLVAGAVLLQYKEFSADDPARSQ
jgi:ABC-type transport system involved in multi-copper enzyme maturation permease subunit